MNVGRKIRSGSARSVALRALMAGGDSSASLDRELTRSGLDARDRAFATELAHGTLKRRRTLEWVVQTCLDKPFATLDIALQWVLLLGAYQLLYLQRVPAHSAVDESVSLARAAGHAGHAALANAVLRRLARELPAPPIPTPENGAPALGLYASLPDWIARHLVDRFGFERALAIAEGLNAPPRRALRVDLTKWSLDEARQALEAAGYTLAPSRLGVPECLIVTDAPRSSTDQRAELERLVAAGKLTVQSEESQFAVHLLDPRPGETVLDVCAGRGMKTGAIAARLRGSGRIVAIDDDPTKLAQLASAAVAFATPVGTVRADARSSYPGAVPALADAVMVDAPCSGLGIIGRRADARWRKNSDDPVRFSRVQGNVLARAAEHVRPGGRLLYVTCSTAIEEDEQVVAAFLKGRATWRAHTLVPPPDAPAMTQVTGGALLCAPGIGGSDGFFYALLERIA